MDEPVGSQFLDEFGHERQAACPAGVGRDQIFRSDTDFDIGADGCVEGRCVIGEPTVRPDGDATGRRHGSAHHVHRRRTDERGDEPRSRPLINVGRSPHLLDAALIHDDDLIGQRHGLHLIVRDENRGRFQAIVQPADLDAHLDAQLGVEIGQRLVEQERLRFAHDGAPHGHALPLPAGQLARLAIEIRRNVEKGGGLAHAPLDFGLGCAAVAQAIGHVVVDAHVRIERVILEDHGDVAIGRLDVVDDAFANVARARRNRLEAGDHAQQRGFSAA